MNNTTKVRPTLRIEPKTAQRVEQWYKAANCRSQNEFMERAINFYADYLEMNDSNDLLPQALQSYLDGRLSQLERRLSAISFDCMVGLDELTGIIADSYEFTEEELRRRRRDSINTVKKTNGFISLETRVRMSAPPYSDEEDNQW